MGTESCRARYNFLVFLARTVRTDFMARLPRLVVPQQPHHVIQRGIDNQPVFREPADYSSFLGWLRDAARQFNVAIHAYALLPDRIDLLVTPTDATGLGRMMQWVGRHYVPYFNGKYGRAGTLWQGRYKAAVLDAEKYFLACTRYVELAPVRAGLAGSAAEYPWSSYAHHAGAKSDPLITDHARFWALANTPFGREAAYRTLAEQALTNKEMEELGEAALKGWALGSDQFKGELERRVKRRISPAKRGRPPKKVEVEQVDS
jgi:putative transposase